MTDISPRTPCSNRSATERVPLIGTKATADFHQGAQPPCCNPDAVYMAATEITPASPERPLPCASHPYTVQGERAGAQEPRRRPRQSRGRWPGGSISTAPQATQTWRTLSPRWLRSSRHRHWRRAHGRSSRITARVIRMPRTTIIPLHGPSGRLVQRVPGLVIDICQVARRPPML